MIKTKKPISIETYLKRIKGFVLPEPDSQIIHNFAKFVAHNDLGLVSPEFSREGYHNFNFYISPGDLVEIKERDFALVPGSRYQYLHYGISGHPVYDVINKLPKVVYDAGKAVLPEDLGSPESLEAMVGVINKMIKEIQKQRKIHYSFRAPVSL